jgi:SAM-dependent methyltransferase
MAPWQVSIALSTAKAVMPFQDGLRQIKRAVVPPRMGGQHQSALTGALEQVAALKAAGVPVAGRRVLEIGAGWYPVAPLIYRLAGACSVLLADAHRLLHPRNVLAALDFVRERAPQIQAALGISADEIDKALRPPAGLDFEALLQWLGFAYAAPFDIETCPTVDIVFSHTVLEHISPEGLFDFFNQIKTKLAPGGAVCHGVDHSDHRANTDPKLSDIDFLRYSDTVWRLLCINPQDYTNRLRRSDYLALFERTGYQVLSDTSYQSDKARASLAGLPLKGRFRDMDPTDLCTTWSLLVAKPV